MQSLKVPNPSSHDTSVKEPTSSITTDRAVNKAHCAVFEEHNNAVSTSLAESSSRSLLLPSVLLPRQKYRNSGAPSSRSKEFQVKPMFDLSA